LLRPIWLPNGRCDEIIVKAGGSDSTELWQMKAIDGAYPNGDWDAGRASLAVAERQSAN
jgi:hypothetical protein